VSIDVTVVVLNQPYGNPGSLGEPLGHFSGLAPLAGDATGGFTRVTFVPQNPTDTPTLADHRRQYVWFVDGIGIHDGAASPGFFTVEVETHWASPVGAAFAEPNFSATLAAADGGAGQFHPRGILLPDNISRFPIFWDAQALGGVDNTIVRLTLETNVDNNEGIAQVHGRYYDRQILANRALGRLTAPPAVSQF